MSETHIRSRVSRSPYNTVKKTTSQLHTPYIFLGFNSHLQPQIPVFTTTTNMTNTEPSTTPVQEASAQLTTTEIRVEKRPSPVPEGNDESPPSLKKQKTEEPDEPMEDSKADDITIPPTLKKEAAVAELVAPSTKLLVKKLSAKGRVPTRGSALAAGYDMYRYVFAWFSQLVDGTDDDSAHETMIPARGKALVDTDISIAVPIGTCKFFHSKR